MHPQAVSADATVVIVTRNRRRDLERALRSTIVQLPEAKALVIDDASTDGTAEMVAELFPEVVVHQTSEARGYIVQRNRAAALAHSDVIISIDDDAAFSSPSTIAQALAHFDHPRVGAVAIPVVNPNQQGGPSKFRLPGGEIVVVPRFIGTAHAVRRDIFLRLGGYRADLFHQGEEDDFCLRMLAAGYVTRLANADPIYHFESPHRDLQRMDLYGRRNDLLFAWHNVPMPYVFSHIARKVLVGLIFGMRVGRPTRMLRGLSMGFTAIAQSPRVRRPVPRDVYRLYRRLAKAGQLPLREVEANLPPISLFSPLVGPYEVEDA